jgi:hypothetical protein
VCPSNHRPLPACNTRVEDNTSPELSRIYSTFKATVNLIFAPCSLTPHTIRFASSNYNNLVPTSSMIYAQIDPCANISCTPHLDLLTGVVPLQYPLPIDGADACSASMISYSAGWFAVYFQNSTNPINIYMHHCKDLAITIISPQHACDRDHSPFDGWGILARHSQQAFLQFHLRN